MIMDSYIYKEVDKISLNDLSKFLNSVFKTNKFSESYLNNIYFEVNRVIGYNVYFKKKIIAHYCVVTRNYNFEKKSIKIGWSVNTAVHLDHRGRGFFFDLASRSYNLAKKNGVDAIVGVANKNSTRLFIEKLKFKDLGNIKWNFDIISVYKKRKIFPSDFNHVRSKLFYFFNNIYLLKFPLFKLYSENNVSLFSIYLTNRKIKFRLGFTLPNSLFKSNWKVIAFNLFDSDELKFNFINRFIDNFNIDILESDTF